MRILVVCPHVPYPLDNGGSIRAFHIAAGLAKRHHVHLLALSQLTPRKIDLEALRAVFDEVTIVPHQPKRILNAVRGLFGRPYPLRNYWTESFEKALTLAMEHSDIALFNSLHTAQYARTDWPCVADSHNVEHVQWRRWSQIAKTPLGRFYCARESHLLQRWQLGVTKIVGAIFACSKMDAVLLGPKAVLAPNGVDVSKEIQRKPEAATFVFIGDMSWRPNADAARQLAEHILPELLERLPESRVELVGKHADRLSRFVVHPRLQVIGAVESVQPYLERATAAVVPLRTGSGTRLKILEAMAAGVPVVTTTVGCEGLNVAHEENVLIGDTVEAFADSCARVSRDPELAEKLSANALDLARREYTWDRTINIVEETCGIVATAGAHDR